MDRYIIRIASGFLEYNKTAQASRGWGAYLLGWQGRVVSDHAKAKNGSKAVW